MDRLRRKRSHRVFLAVIGTVGAAAAAGLWLAEKEPDGADGETMFRSIDECRQTYDADSCAAKYAEAKTEHDQLAPKYASREDCEREIGSGLCMITDEPPRRPDGEVDRSATMPAGGWFVPAFAGFLVGRSLLGPAVPLHYGPPPAGQAPDCPRNPDGSCRTTGGGSGSGSHVYYCGGSPGASGVRTAAYAGTVAQSSGRSVFTTASMGGRASSGIANAARGGFGAAGRAASGGGSS